jgi:arginase
MKKTHIVGAACGLGAKNRLTELGPKELNKIWQREKSSYLCHPILQVQGELTKNKQQNLATLTPYYQTLAELMSKIIQKQQLPIVIGGDHSIAIGTWSGIISAKKAEGNFGLIWVDAHMDAHTYKTSPSKSLHGMPVATLLGYGEKELTQLATKANKLSPQHLVLIGIRSFEKEEEKLLRDLGVKIFYIEEVRAKGFAAVFQEALKIVTKNTDAFGISVDVDAFDPDFAPGTGTPVAQGLSPLEFLKICKGLGRHQKIAGIEIVEYNPTLDKEEKTGKLVASILTQMLK